MPNGDGSVSPDGRRPRRFSPAARHLASLALFYMALASGIAVLQRAYPGITSPVTGVPQGLVTARGILRAITVMLGALALALPLAWGFVITRRRKGFSQSIVHTLIILPIAVAGIMRTRRWTLARSSPPDSSTCSSVTGTAIPISGVGLAWATRRRIDGSRFRATATGRS